MVLGVHVLSRMFFFFHILTSNSIDATNLQLVFRIQLLFTNPPSGALAVSVRKTVVGSPDSSLAFFGLLIVRASPGPTLVYDPAPFFSAYL